MAEGAAVPHRWRFFRLGGFDQVRLDRAEDLEHLAELDPKLWSVLSCPTSGLEIDRRTLELIDSDGDGHIRVPEILEAVSWARGLLKDPASLLEGGDSLPLAAIDDSKPEGARLLASARQILTNLHKPDADSVSVAESSDKSKIFSPGCFNGDGIVSPSLTEDEDLRAVITEIMERFGAESDRSGELGVSQAKVDAFFEEARAFLASWDRAHAEAGTVLPLGDDTVAAGELLESLQAKIDDYFTRCRLAAFDPRAAARLNPPEEVYGTLSSLEISASADAVAALPLAQVAPDRPLPLAEGLNPAWVGRLEQFRREIVVPLIGERTELGQQDWQRILDRLGPYRAWRDEKAGEHVASLGPDRLRAIVGSGAQDAINELIERDNALEAHAESIDAVERLARYHRDLFLLLHNFVTLRDFYGTRGKAIFQAGTLYLDGRSCDLCLRVDDMARHSTIAHFSGTYLAYCECERKGQEKMMIVAGITGGDADNLMVGRNGVFYDRQGRDWDANVVKLVENPISIRQAFWSPYKRIARLMQEQIQKFAASRDQAVEERATAGIAGAAERVESGQKPAPAAPFDIAKFAGIFAAIGLAIGAIGTALAAVVAGLFNLAWWQAPLVAVGVLLAVSGPSMLLAWLKLRRRNLAPLLDANGWAVNTRARINLPFGTALTGVAALPPGSQRSLDDPYAEKKRPWKTYLFLLALVIVVIAAWWQGYLGPVVESLLETLRPPLGD